MQPLAGDIWQQTNKIKNLCGLLINKATQQQPLNDKS